MSNTPSHRVIAADAFAVPQPFRTFAVRSEEPLHAMSARAPYHRVHVIRTGFLTAAGLAALAADGRARTQVSAFSDIDHAHLTPEALVAATPQVGDLVGEIAGALRATGVLGAGLDAYLRSVAARIDYVAACGAGFHNDVSRHWTRCLFWNLALVADDVEFVMPHAGVRHALRDRKSVV